LQPRIGARALCFKDCTAGGDRAEAGQGLEASIAMPQVCKTLKFHKESLAQQFQSVYGLHILFVKQEHQMAVVGYARVSTQDQNLSGQLAALKTAGATTIYREKISGVRADRPQLAKLMAALGDGDVVVVTKLDRLGRSTRELLDLIDRIGKAGASFRSLGDPLWDTGSSQGRLLSTMLAAIAEFERELIRERTGEGRKRAMAAGVKFGRKRKLSDYQRAEAVKRRAAGETLASIAKSYAVDVSMISRFEA
jgi:DNA invertase Pin-like site-specific DNA recombinase